MMGGYKVRHSAGAQFSFNTTYDHRTNGSTVGLVVSDPLGIYKFIKI